MMYHDESTHITQTLTDFWQQLAAYHIHGLVVAYSGGLDSTVLLHLCRQAPIPVSVIHIHHGLQADADRWASHSQKIAAAWQMPYTCVHIDTSPQPGESVEAWARTQRYQALISALNPGECLLTAHHEDDQAETLLIQLCRGAGIKGMAAMPAWRRLDACQKPSCYHARPLLNVSRQQLVAYAKTHVLTYDEDPSNTNIRFLRNHIRHQMMPLLRQHFPEVQRNLARTAKHCAESADLLTELAYIDVPALQAGPLDIRQLSTLSMPRQKNVLRTWLAIQEFDMPSATHMQVLLQDVLQSRYDKAPLLTWSDIEIRRYGFLLYVLKKLSKVPLDWSASWNLSQDLSLPSNLGYLSATSMQDLATYQPLTVRFRRDGESVRLLGHQHHKSLKNLMQQYRVPPWLRDRTPLLFHGEYLVAIAGYYQVTPVLPTRSNVLPM